MEIKASDVAKLRQMTGAGMMDCKKALTEANGNYDEAVKIIRERGKAIANKRADREAGEGVVLVKTSSDNQHGALIVLNCETDFVAKNNEFIAFAESILNTAINEKPATLDALKALKIDNRLIADKLTDATGKIGEKIELSFYTSISAAFVTGYIHPGNKVSSIVGFTKKPADLQVAKDIAMQVTAMNPVSVDKNSVPADVIQRELEIGREQARLEGKAENMLDKIAQGKLNKFFKENTLLEQMFIKDQKKTVTQYLQETDKDLTVTAFVRYSLTD